MTVMSGVVLLGKLPPLPGEAAAVGEAAGEGMGNTSHAIVMLKR